MHLKRLLTALVLAPLVVGLLLSGWTIPFYLLLIAVACLAQWEYLSMAFPGSGYAELRVFGLILAASVVVWPMFAGTPGIVFAAGLFVLSFCFFVIRSEPVESAFTRTSRFLLGLAYAPLMISLFIPIWSVADAGLWLILALGTVFMGDTGAFYAGRNFGRRPLAPKVSPKKTVEGSIGSIVASEIFAVLFSVFALPEASTVGIVVLALIMNVLGQTGDLFESLLKRSAGVKDSGTLLPGHGGILDRIDGVLFAIPALSIYLHCFHLR